MKAFWLPVAVLTLSLGTNFALADTYSGVLCRASGANSALGYNQWGVYNQSVTDTTTVVCGSHSAGGVHEVSITTYDRSSTQDLTCTVHLVNGAGDDLESPVTRQTSGFGNRPQTTAVARFNGSIGTVIVECTLPPWDGTNGGSGIAGYQIL